MRAQELEERAENLFWLIKVFSQHFWAWLRGFASIPGTFQIPEMICLRGSCKGQLKDLFSGSRETSQPCFRVAGGEIPAVSSIKASPVSWNRGGGSHKYRSFWLEAGGMCAYRHRRASEYLDFTQEVDRTLKAGGENQSCKP